MCTLALYFRAVEAYPMIVAANRDERYNRPSFSPALWSTNPKILAGKDLLAGGTWLGVNEHGLLVGILNRRLDVALDPMTQTRSRGLLCLDLLRLQSAADACAFVNRHDEAYQPFTVVFVDPKEAWVAANVGHRIRMQKLEPGLHVYSSATEFPGRSEKADRAALQFAQVAAGLGSSGRDPSAWVRALRAVLADHSLGNGSTDPREAICVHGDLAGTVSSTIIFFSSTEQRFYTFNCSAPPCGGSFAEPLTFDVR
jgi:uncharacterized protein with NRDE domain